MSQAEANEQIRRLECLADAIAVPNMLEANSLLGQAEGTVRAIQEIFQRHGVETTIPELRDLGYVEVTER